MDSGVQNNNPGPHTAHCIKNPLLGTSRMVMRMPGHMTVLVTATPTLNSVEDLFGMVLHFWRRAGFYDFTFPAQLKDDWRYIATKFEMVDVGLPEIDNPYRPKPSREWTDGLSPEAIHDNNILLTEMLLWYKNGFDPFRPVPDRQQLLD
jgi:hypothetical protein